MNLPRLPEGVNLNSMISLVGSRVVQKIADPDNPDSKQLRISKRSFLDEQIPTIYSLHQADYEQEAVQNIRTLGTKWAMRGVATREPPQGDGAFRQPAS